MVCGVGRRVISLWHYLQSVPFRIDVTCQMVACQSLSLPKLAETLVIGRFAKAQRHSSVAMPFPSWPAQKGLHSDGY
jgi:hypothetical protein